jgi:hypothetical protein
MIAMTNPRIKILGYGVAAALWLGRPRHSPGFGPEPEQSYGLDRGFVLGGEYFGPYESEYFAR